MSDYEKRLKKSLVAYHRLVQMPENDQELAWIQILVEDASGVLLEQDTMMTEANFRLIVPNPAPYDPREQWVVLKPDKFAALRRKGSDERFREFRKSLDE